MGKDLSTGLADFTIIFHTQCTGHVEVPQVHNWTCMVSTCSRYTALEMSKTLNPPTFSDAGSLTLEILTKSQTSIVFTSGFG